RVLPSAAAVLPADAVIYGNSQRLQPLPAAPLRTSAAASAIRSGEVPMFRRAKPRPWAPKPGPELRATRPRATNSAARSSPTRSAGQPSQAGKLASGATYAAERHLLGAGQDQRRVDLRSPAALRAAAGRRMAGRPAG